MKLETSLAWLRKRFYDERKSIADIAKEAGCSESTIRRRLKEKGLIK